MLNQLKSFFRSMPALQELLLILPVSYGHPSYLFTDVFPPITDWEMASLQVLRLGGLIASYEDLVGLLFLNIASADMRLDLVDILLADGDWGDIIEGLRWLSPTTCNLVTLRCAQNEKYYWGEIDEDQYYGCMVKLGYYVCLGGQQPCLPPDTNTQPLMDRFTKTLESLRALKQRKRMLM